MSEESSHEHKDEPQQPAGTSASKGDQEQKESGGAAAEVVEGKQEGTAAPTPGGG